MPNPKKTKSTIMVDSELWKRLRIITVLNDMEISEFVEEALREKLEKIQQPEQYQAYKDVENIRLPTGKQKQQQQPQSQSQQQQMQESNIFEDDVILPSAQDYIKTSFPMWLPPINYPINKEGLIQLVKEFRNEFTRKYKKIPLQMERALFVMENLPNTKNKFYKNAEDLDDDLAKVVTNKEVVMKLFGRPKKMVGCAIMILDTERKKDVIMKKMIENDDNYRRQYQRQEQELTS